MPYEVELSDLADSELKALRKYELRRIMDEIARQLVDQPAVPTRKRKNLGVTAAGFDYVPPLWELRVGNYRVFYDVDESARVVVIRAVRHEGSSQMTEEILQ